MLIWLSSLTRWRLQYTRINTKLFYTYDCVDIRIYLLSVTVDGEFVPIQVIMQRPKVKAILDKWLFELVEEYNNTLQSLVPNISNYENMACSLTNDSIYDGSLFNLLPHWAIEVYMCA